MSCEHTVGEETLSDEAILITGCGCAYIGATVDGRARYSYEKLIEHFHTCERMGELDHPDEEYTSAIEWIDYNVLGGLPYTGGLQPTIEDDNGYDFVAGEDPDEEED